MPATPSSPSTPANPNSAADASPADPSPAGPSPAASSSAKPLHLAALVPLGWDDGHAAVLPSGLTPGRVTRVDRGEADVLTAAGPVRAVVARALLATAATDPVAAPGVGDWVGLTLPAASSGSVGPPTGRASLEAVLPRRTAFLRTAVAPGTSRVQLLAANVDIAGIVEGLLPEPDLARIERLLALAWDSGATPVVVLTKADLVPDADEVTADVAAAAPGVDVLAVSAATGAGIEALAAHLGAGRTLALLGPSGAGKSTLTNALVGSDRMATRALRADGKGRHTTAHRELVPLPSGGLVIDTPGLRSVGLTDSPQAVDRVFADLDELAAQCRFADCGHESEPGCAVLAAVESGALAARRLDSWRKLQRETRWMATRVDARLRAQEQAVWRRRSLELRRSGRARP